MKKKLRFFGAVWCPHCKNSEKWIQELIQENPEYAKLDIEHIDIDRDKDKMQGVSFDLVPTFYLEDEKIFEGAPTKDTIKQILDKSL